MSSGSNEADERARALALLEATHQFPTEYYVSVIALNTEAVFLRVRAAVEHGGPLGEGAYEQVASSGGKYLSHRFRVHCDAAPDVLALYQRLRGIDGVMSVL